MYPVPAECPVCNSDLFVTELVCPNCNTEIRNKFEMDALSRLIPAQRHFVEVFLLCEGKLNCLQEQLGISYPTARSRLDEIIRALNQKTAIPSRPEPTPAPPPSVNRQEILALLASQQISAEEALKLLGH